MDQLDRLINFVSSYLLCSDDFPDLAAPFLALLCSFASPPLSFTTWSPDVTSLPNELCLNRLFLFHSETKCEAET